MAQTTSKSLQEPSKDFFISYNRADRNWAEWIAWQLEQTGFSVIIQEWDFRPGSNFVVEMDRASQQARRTIAILSHDYLHANDKKAEWAAAFQRDPTGEQSVLVPVRVKACDLKGLFSSIVYIDLVDLDETSAQEALLQGIRSRRARPSIAPAFPGRSQPPSFPGSEKQGTSSDLAMNPGSRRDILTEGQTGIEQAPESTANDLLIPSSLYLPPKVYHRLVGRSNELNKIMAALRAQKRRPMIALFGLGGMGKTALAREAVDRSQQLHLFDDIVWTSAKTERFIGETTIKTENSEYNFDEVLNSIGRQCNRLDITKLPLEKKTAAVQHLLANKRILIVMDNLETVAQSEVVVDNIFQILRKSKVIITSRHRIEHEQTFTMNLSGLSLDDGVSFLKEYSRERGIAVIGQAKPSTLVDIHQITGGAPLAMKLVVGQIANQPMSVVLTALKLVSFKGQDYEFYRFIYQHSWELLDEPSRMVLVEMSVFPPTEGGALTDVQEVSQLAPSDFWSAMNLLVLMSLVDKTGQVDQERFALHPLTHYFILSDITQEWNES